jgi:hypothetical protein
MHLTSLSCAAMLVCAGATTAQLVPTRTATFDNGTTEGFTETGATAFFGATTNGNPGGYLHVDNSEGPVCYVFAPASWLGDLRSYRGGTLSFDGRMIGTGGAPWSSSLDYGHVFLRTNAAQVVVDLEPALPSTTAWTTYTVALDPVAWNTTPAIFEQILANVTELRISVEALFGAEVQAIDNVVLAPGPTPATATPFGAGCGAYALTASSLPWIGTTFQSTASGLTGIVIGVTVFGFQPVAPPLPLTTVFAQAQPGCALHVSPDVLGTFVTGNATATTQLTIPASPPLVGGVFWHQVVPLQMGPNVAILSVGATNGLALRIGAL